MANVSRIVLPKVLIITGASAAGKSTVAQAIAERLDKAVHVRGDLFRRMIVRGRTEPTPDNTEAWRGQLNLRYELAWAVADRYAREGFTVIYQDILNDALLPATEALAAWRPGAVVLCPPPEVLAAREAGRDKTAYKDGWTPAVLDAAVRSTTPRIGLWLDTAAMSVSETVDYILAHPEATRTGLDGAR